MRPMAVAVVLVATLLATAAALAGPVERAAAQTAPGCVVSLDGLLGWWRGEDDLQARVGPALSGTTSFADGAVGRAFRTGSAAELAAPTLPVVTSAVTVEAWVRPDPVFTGLMRTIASRWNEPGGERSRSFNLQLDPFGALVWSIDDPSTRRPTELRVSTPQLLDGTFHHVAGTFDGTTLAVFVDGVNVGSSAFSGTIDPASDSVFRVGAKDGTGAPLWFDGELDEVSVWSRSLTAGEVATIHGAGIAGKCTLLPVEQGRFTAPSNAANARFGQSVGVSGTTLVAGAPFSNAASQFGGAAYVFTSTNGITWSTQAVLVVAGTAPVDYVGWAADVDADTIVLGAYGSNAGGADSGAAYVFARSGPTWSQQARLLPTDAVPGDGNGYAVAIDGDTAVVGAPLKDGAVGDEGAAYVFRRSGTTWTQEAKLVAPTGGFLDNFGAAVAIDADTIVVGSPGVNTAAGFDAGAAYVFRRTGTMWSLEAELTSSTSAAEDEYGTGVAVDGDVIAVGAPQKDAPGGAGTVILHARTGTVWTETSRLVASDPDAGDRFGFSVAISGSRLVAGAPWDGPGGSQAGAAYVFDRAGGVWSETTKVVASDSAPGDQFGYDVDVASRIAVGAHLDDDRGNNAGAAYVFGP